MSSRGDTGTRLGPVSDEFKPVNHRRVVLLPRRGFNAYLHFQCTDQCIWRVFHGLAIQHADDYLFRWGDPDSGNASR